MVQPTPAGRIVLLQVAITLAVAGALAPFSLAQASAALAGGAVCVTANGWFAWRLAHSRSAARIVVLAAERSVLMALLLCLAIVGLRPALGGFLATFAFVHVAFLWQPTGKAR